MEERQIIESLTVIKDAARREQWAQQKLVLFERDCRKQCSCRQKEYIGGAIANIFKRGKNRIQENVRDNGKKRYRIQNM